MAVLIDLHLNAPNSIRSTGYFSIPSALRTRNQSTERIVLPSAVLVQVLVTFAGCISPQLRIGTTRSIITPTTTVKILAADLLAYRDWETVSQSR